MSDYNPSALLRLSMSLKQIRPLGNSSDSLQDLRRAARILESLSCLADPETTVNDALERASQVRGVTSQRKTEAVIERRIREGLWSAALKLGKHGFPDGHPIEIAQAGVCQCLLHARRAVDLQYRQTAYDQAERALQELRGVVRSSPTTGAGAVNETIKEASQSWLACDPLDMAAFDRYIDVAAITSTSNPVAAARRPGRQPA